MSEPWTFITQTKPFIQRAWKNAKFNQPTEIQRKAASLILEKRDLIAESPTGTGKTLAYLLPLLESIDPLQKQVQVVILAPSRELVMQIFDEVKKWATDSGIHSATLIGGANIKRQIEGLKKKPQLIVGTPGRILELIKIKKLKMHEVKTIVLDEGDQLLVPEHEADIQAVIKSTLQDRQLLYFSATLPESAYQKATELMKDSETISINKTSSEKSAVDHIYFVCEKRDKIVTLQKFIHTGNYKALAFLNDVGGLSVFSQKLTYKGLDHETIHGESTKGEREQAIKAFRHGKIPLLLATDVAARGLDIKGLTHVIHVDLPKTKEQYVHRSGRTGRQGNTGTVVSIVTPSEEPSLKKICRELNITLTKKELYRGKVIDESPKTMRH